MGRIRVEESALFVAPMRVHSMATVLTRPELGDRRMVLHDVSWATYEALLSDHVNRSVPHFTFDHGVLEIVSPSFEHEDYNGILAEIVTVYAHKLGIRLRCSGSTTFRRGDWGYGFEPDSSFYIQNEPRIRGKIQIDPKVDPPPDLVIEIDISRSSLDKLPLYAQFGVPEVWRYDGEKMLVYRLAGEAYADSEESAVLPGLTAADVSRFLEQGRSLDPISWSQTLREWIRGRKGRL
jgi:Uma2 family endonuclease